jgi:hypothetical protein
MNNTSKELTLAPEDIRYDSIFCTMLSRTGSQVSTVKMIRA